MSDNMEFILSNQMLSREQFINEVIRKLPKVKIETVRKIFKYYSDNQIKFISNNMNINQIVIDCIRFGMTKQKVLEPCSLCETRSILIMPI